jgi:hypothetical protein
VLGIRRDDRSRREGGPVTRCSTCHTALDDYEVYRLYPDRPACGSCYDQWHEGQLDEGPPWTCTTHNHPSWSRVGPYPDCEIVRG